MLMPLMAPRLCLFIEFWVRILNFPLLKHFTTRLRLMAFALARLREFSLAFLQHFYQPLFTPGIVMALRFLILQTPRVGTKQLLLMVLLDFARSHRERVTLLRLLWWLRTFKSVLLISLLKILIILPLVEPPVFLKPLSDRLLYWALGSLLLFKRLLITNGSLKLLLMLLSEVRDILSDSLFPKINEIVIEVPRWVKARFPRFWTRRGTQSVLLHISALNLLFYQFPMLSRPELEVQL